MNDPRRIDVLGHIALIVVAAVFSATLAKYVLVPLLESQEKIAQFRQALAVLSQADGDLARLDGEIRRIQEELAASEALLPSEINLDSFLDQVEDMATSEGVRVKRLAPSSLKRHTLFRELAVDLEVTGRFTSIAGFLSRLENADRISRVNSLRMTAARDKRDCSARMSLALYYAPEDRG